MYILFFFVESKMCLFVPKTQTNEKKLHYNNIILCLCFVYNWRHYNLCLAGFRIPTEFWKTTTPNMACTDLLLRWLSDSIHSTCNCWHAWLFCQIWEGPCISILFKVFWTVSTQVRIRLKTSIIGASAFRASDLVHFTWFPVILHAGFVASTSTESKIGIQVSHFDCIKPPPWRWIRRVYLHQIQASDCIHLVSKIRLSISAAIDALAAPSPSSYIHF